MKKGDQILVRIGNAVLPYWYVGKGKDENSVTVATAPNLQYRIGVAKNLIVSRVVDKDKP